MHSFINTRSLLILFCVPLISIGALANTVTKITPSAQNVEPNKPFSLTFTFAGEPSNVGCGLVIDWGDGKVEKFRAGEGHQLLPPYTVEHTYTTSGDYRIRVTGEAIARGLRSVLACDVKREGTIAVMDAAEASKRAEAKAAAEREQRAREETEARTRKEREEAVKAEAASRAAKEAEERAKRATEIQRINKNLLAKASIKSCEQFLSVFASRYKYAYDWPDSSCQETNENDAVFVITGKNPSRRHPSNISQYWYQPRTETVLYTVPHRASETLRVSDFRDASKPPPGPNDTPDGVGKQAWRERCTRHAAAKSECAVASNPYQCMEIKLGSLVLNMGNTYCRGSQPDFRLMGAD